MAFTVLVAKLFPVTKTSDSHQHLGARRRKEDGPSPSRLRSTWYRIGMEESPGRRKYEWSE